MMHGRRILRGMVVAWNLAAPVFAIVWLFQGHCLAALLAVMSAHALWLASTLWPSCAWYGEIITTLPQARRAPGSASFTVGETKELWLTIDDGPDPRDTPLLLDLLDAYGAKATFFFIGARAQAHPGLVRQVLDRGHETANHTMTHPRFWFWAYGPGAVRRELRECQAVLSRLGDGPSLRWFRAPAGFKNPFVQTEVERLGLRLACWSVRGRDGVITDQAEILSRLKKGVAPGAVLLMHEGRGDGRGGRLAPQVLAQLLAWLQQQGYRCVLP